MLGFLALPLGFAWPHFSAWQRYGTIALLAASILINFACTAVDMTAGSLIEQIMPSFFSSDLRQTLTYKVLKRTTVLHFAAPLFMVGILGWLTMYAAQGTRVAGQAR
jgi:hypothetical protein